MDRQENRDDGDEQWIDTLRMSGAHHPLQFMLHEDWAKFLSEIKSPRHAVDMIRSHPYFFQNFQELLTMNINYMVFDGIMTRLVRDRSAHNITLEGVYRIIRGVHNGFPFGGTLVAKAIYAHWEEHLEPPQYVSKLASDLSTIDKNRVFNDHQVPVGALWARHVSVQLPLSDWATYMDVTYEDIEGTVWAERQSDHHAVFVQNTERIGSWARGIKFRLNYLSNTELEDQIHLILLPLYFLQKNLVYVSVKWDELFNDTTRRFLAFSLPRLPRLRHLKLKTNLPAQIAAFDFAAVFPQLSKLQVSFASWNREWLLRRVENLFPNLESLSLLDVRRSSHVVNHQLLRIINCIGAPQLQRVTFSFSVDASREYAAAPAQHPQHLQQQQQQLQDLGWLLLNARELLNRGRPRPNTNWKSVVLHEKHSVLQFQ